MIHKEGLLANWQRCCDKVAPTKIEPLLQSEATMQWDVVEIRPEADYSLFLRFKDGLSGRVRLDPVEFTGVLTLLRDVEFFNRVYIDGGAPAWPGEIDLAPDALYRQIAGERDLRQRAS